MRGHACRGEAPPLPAALVSRDQQTADRGPPLFIFVGDTCTRIVVKRERTRAEGALHGAISDLLHSHDWIHAAWVVRSRGVISFPVWRMLAPGPAVRCVSTADTKLRCPSYAVRSFSRQWPWQWPCLSCSSSTFCGPLDISRSPAGDRQQSCSPKTRRGGSRPTWRSCRSCCESLSVTRRAPPK
jgi:hypothetical protein